MTDGAAPTWAILDSGATKTVCGEAAWDKFSNYLVMRDLMDKVDFTKDTKDFRFGDGVSVRSQTVAKVPVCVGKKWRTLLIHVLLGHAPLLLARPGLELGPWLPTIAQRSSLWKENLFSHPFQRMVTALHRAPVEEDELMVGDYVYVYVYVYYWKPQANKLDPFRWRGPCVVAVEPTPNHTDMFYRVVHGSSLVRGTLQQLRYEPISEKYERQSSLSTWRPSRNKFNND